jgi:hypothetical protein
MAAWPCVMGHQAETGMGGLSQAKPRRQLPIGPEAEISPVASSVFFIF